MDHSSAVSPHFSLATHSFEVPVECKDGIADDDRRVPGKALYKVFDAVGHRIDRALSKAVARAGYGPLVTAEKIRRRAYLLEWSFWHYERDNCRGGCDEDYLHSLPSIKAEADKLLKDVKRLLKYVKYVA